MSAKLKTRPSKPSRPQAKPEKHPRKPLQRATPVVAARHKTPPRPVKAMATKPVVAAVKPNGVSKPSKTESKSKASAKIVEPAIPADKDLSTKSNKGVVKDRIFLMVPDPHWLHVHWELTLQSVQRAEAALGQEWYGAKPVIRLFDVTSQDTTSTAESQLRDIPIHGGVNHWYIDVPQPPRTYRADIGYITRRGHFHPLCRSNVVTPPKAGASESLEESWTSDIDEKAAERLIAMSSGFDSANGSSQREHFDDQVKRSSKDSAFGNGAALPDKLKKFAFEISAELIVTGRTDPTATVSLQNEPVKIRTDGTFVMRYTLTDGRQIIPAVATSSDGMEERTIVLAVERNTKHLDPAVHDLFSSKE